MRPGGPAVVKIAFFTGGGPFGLAAMEALAGTHEIVAVVMPQRPTARWRRWIRGFAAALAIRPAEEVVRWAKHRGVPRFMAGSGSDPRVVAALGALAPDLVCIATFSWKLADNIIRIPRLGAINLHPSLLPRHRGANPYFWTYYHDDRHAGLTVHVVTERLDGGPILAQQWMPLPRGWPVHECYLESARQGAMLLRRTVARVEDQLPRGTPQDETRATAAPRVPPGRAMVDFHTWDVERVWHFLHGLCPRFREPLLDAANRPVRYTRVLGYQEGPTTGRPGTVAPAGRGWMLWCRDGYVHLAGPGERHSPRTPAL